MTGIKLAIIATLIYTATRTIKHNGTSYQDGDLIELEERWATPLLKCGAIVLNDKARAAQATKDAAEQQAAAEQEALEAERRAKAIAEQAKAEQAKAEQQAADQSPNKMTVEQLKAALTAKGIEFAETAKKPDLIALLG
jgi:hypothetical protein